MSIREMSHVSKNKVPVARGLNPVMAFQDEMNKLFSDFFGEMHLPAWFRDREAAAVSPAMDVTENDKEFKIAAELPGMDAKDVQIYTVEGYVTIKGEKKQEHKEERKGYFRQERSYGSFQRVIALPDTANLDKAEAVFKNGVLTLTIAKKPGAQSKERKIEIKQVA